MALKAFELYGEIFLKDNKTKEGLKGIDKQGSKTSKTIGKLAKVVGGAVTLDAFKNLGKAMLSSAGDALEMESKFNTVFGNTAQQADDWSKQFQRAVGGSRYEIKGMLADSQDLLTGFGATAQEGLELSTKIQSLGTDLASFGNITGGSSEAVERLRKGLLGEHENLKALGIVINETALKQELARQGDHRKLKELTELEKIELRYSIAVQQSQNAIGDAEKTSGSYANQVKALRGEIKDLVTEAGKELIPIFKDIVENLRKNEKTITNVLKLVTAAFKVLGGVLGFVVNNIYILLPLLIAIGTIIVAHKMVKLVSDVSKSFGKVTKFLGSMNPEMLKTVGIVILVVAALTALGVIIATIMGRSKEMQESFKSIGEATQGIGQQMQGGGSNVNPRQLPQFADGINNLPSDMVAMVHKGEAIVPKEFNPYNPDASTNGMGNGQTINIYVDSNTTRDYNDMVEFANNTIRTYNQGLAVTEVG